MTIIAQTNSLTAKQRLLQKLQKELASNEDPRPPLTVTAEREYYSLSSTQKRLFLLQEIEADATAYNLPVAFRIDGPLSLHLLQKAFEQIVARHDSLRSSFKVLGDEIVQSVHKEVPFQIEYCSHLEDLPKLFLSFVRPFDLARAPLLRVKVNKVSDDEHIVMLDMHHIISDGRSMVILLQEIASLYEGIPIPSLSYQYKDYVEWQKLDFLSLRLQKHKEYWLNQLRGELPQLNLTTDYKRSNRLDSQGNQLFFTLDSNLTTNLKSLAGEQKVTALYAVDGNLSGLFIQVYFPRGCDCRVLCRR